MNVTQKLRRFIAFALLTLFASTLIMAGVRPEVARAEETGYSQFSIEGKAKIWVMGRAVSECIAVRGYENGNKSGSDINDGEWLNGQVGYDDPVNVGEWAADIAEGDSDDSKVKCLPVARETLDLMGMSGTEAVCKMSELAGKELWKRDSGDCASGTGDYDYQEDDNGGENNTDHWNRLFRDFIGGDIEASLTRGMRYVIYSENFYQECSRDHGKSWGTPREWRSGDSEEDKVYKLKWNKNGATPDKYWYVVSGGNGRDKTVHIDGYKMLDSDDKLTCDKLADRINDNAPYFVEEVAKNEEKGIIEGDGGSATGNISADCAGFNLKEVLSLNWMLCPLIQGAMSTANALEGQIAGMLCINETDIFAGADMTCDGERGEASTQKAFHNAWNVFRGLALGLLAIAGLLMIISQGLGFEIFDAYTIKKTLPRILVAAILISLSWPLLEAVVTFSNALGIGIRSLIYQPFIQSGIDTVVLNGGEAAVAAVLGVGGTVAAFALLGTIGMLSFVATALLALLIAFFVLVIRNILVILLVIIAPIAIAMYILPNTEKWAKTWWDWLFKALLAFPIITAMIAIGHVFAAITSQKDGGLLTTIVAFIAYFAPYFLIPASFRFAGGAIATIGGFANDHSRGGFDRLKRYRGGQMEKRSALYGDKIGAAYNQKRATAYRGLNRAASKRTGVGSAALRFAARRVEGIDNMEGVMSNLQAKRIKQMNDQIESGVDSDIRGLSVNKRAALQGGMEATARTDGFTYANSGLFRTGSNGNRQFQSLGGAWLNEADVDAGQRRYKGDHAAQQVSLAYEMRKAMTETQVDGIGARYQELAKDTWDMSDTQAEGAWIGAAFANQNQHLQFKGTDWKTGDLKETKYSNPTTGREHTILGAAFVDEVYEKKGSYNLSQMGSKTITSLESAYESAERVQVDPNASAEARIVAKDQMNKIEAITETFVHDVGRMPSAQQAGSGDDTHLEVTGLQAQQPGGANGQRVASSQGSAHLAERVYGLARRTGVIQSAPAGNHNIAHNPDSHNRQQK